MNTYPIFAQCMGTKMTPRFGRREVRATNGVMRVYVTMSAPKHDGIVVHVGLNTTQRQEFVDFYEANKVDPFIFGWWEDSIGRICKFAPDAYSVDPLGLGLFVVTAKIVEI